MNWGSELLAGGVEGAVLVVGLGDLVFSIRLFLVTGVYSANSPRPPSSLLLSTPSSSSLLLFIGDL